MKLRTRRLLTVIMCLIMVGYAPPTIQYLGIKTAFAHSDVIAGRKRLL